MMATTNDAVDIPESESLEVVGTQLEDTTVRSGENQDSQEIRATPDEDNNDDGGGRRRKGGYQI